MTIKDILTQLNTSQHPIAKAIHKGEHFKVLAIGFKAGMALKDHKAHLPSKLTVLFGTVIYKDENNEVTLSQYDEIDIPQNAMHAVSATEDSLCLLTQG